ncbi:crossover junction endodeoxyribonuclease protein [Rhizobium phage RHph_Y1_11]|nr:crossover junction endodeoxyribonuclease protein [Rhizobium phage RHph_Y1_11]
MALTFLTKPKLVKNPVKRCMGIDQSTKATGIVLADSSKDMDAPEVIEHILLKPKTTWTLYDKQVFMWEGIMAAIEEYAPDLTCLEGYGMNLRRPTAIIPLVGLGEVLRYLLRQQGKTFIEPKPTQVKQFATGKGNADKPKMISTAKKQGFKTDDDNLADAFFLSHLGLGYLNVLRHLSAEQREIIGQLKAF